MVMECKILLYCRIYVKGKSKTVYYWDENAIDICRRKKWTYMVSRMKISLPQQFREVFYTFKDACFRSTNYRFVCLQTFFVFLFLFFFLSFAIYCLFCWFDKTYDKIDCTKIFNSIIWWWSMCCWWCRWYSTSYSMGY